MGNEFIEHPSYVSKKLKRNFSLTSKILDFNNMNSQLKFKLFDTLVGPILTYGCEIWITN